MRLTRPPGTLRSTRGRGRYRQRPPSNENTAIPIQVVDDVQALINRPKQSNASRRQTTTDMVWMKLSARSRTNELVGKERLSVRTRGIAARIHLNMISVAQHGGRVGVEVFNLSFEICWMPDVVVVRKQSVRRALERGHVTSVSRTAGPFQREHLHSEHCVQPRAVSSTEPSSTTIISKSRKRWLSTPDSARWSFSIRSRVGTTTETRGVTTRSPPVLPSL